MRRRMRRLLGGEKRKSSQRYLNYNRYFKRLRIEDLENRLVLSSSTLSIAPASLAEGNSGMANMPFTVTRSGDLSNTVSVGYSTADGTAVAGVDYVATSGTLTMPAGVATATINVPIIGNTIPQLNRTFTISLSGANAVGQLAYTPSFTRTDVNVAGDFSENAITVDMNGDGRQDIVSSADISATYQVVLNNTATGTSVASFAAPQAITAPEDGGLLSLVSADFNGDGKPDLFLGGKTVYMNTTPNSASTVTLGAPYTFNQFFSADAAAVGDINGDGKPDLVLVVGVNSTMSVYLNTTPTGASVASFTAAQNFTVPTFTDHVVVGDMNGDGKPDIAVTCGKATTNVFLNTTGNGSSTVTLSASQTFTSSSTNDSDVSAIADMNGDGKADLLVLNSGHGATILLNTTPNGSMTASFASSQVYTSSDDPKSLAVTDLNGDNVPDLVVGTFFNGGIRVLRNTTSAGSMSLSFAAAESSSSIDGAFGLAAGDLNNDGRPDLVACSFADLSDSVFITQPALVGIATATGTIVDDDSAGVPTVQFTTSGQSALETSGSITVTAQLSFAAASTITIPFTVSGTAISGVNYTITASPITIPAGSLTRTITINLLDDHVKTASKTVVVTMGVATGALVTGTTVHTATILDNDPSPSVQFTASAQTTSESAGTYTIVAQLSATTGLPVTVPFTVSGTAVRGVNYTITASPITIPAGSLSAVITLNLIDDHIHTADTTVVVTMGTPTNALSGTALVDTVTIQDVDTTPGVQFTAASLSALETSGTMTITAQLTATSTQAVTVPFIVSGTAVYGTNYTITASPITIPAGSLTGTATITLIDDHIHTANKTVIVTMSTPGNAIALGTTVSTATILDNDLFPTVQFTAATQSAPENSGGVTVGVQLSSAYGQPVVVPITLSGTAVQGVNYTITPASIIIPIGSMTGTVTLNLIDDGIHTANNTVVLSIGTPTNATPFGTTSQTVTITDVDPLPGVQFTTANQTVIETNGTVTVTAQLTAASGLPITVPFSVSGTAVSGVNYTIAASPITIPAGSLTGSVTVNLLDDNVTASAKTVVVTMGSPTGATATGTTASTVTILDKTSVPTVSLSLGSGSFAKNGSTTVIATLSFAPAQGVTVNLGFGGTATPGVMYRASANSIFIPAGSKTGSITLTGADDPAIDGSQTVTVSIASVVAGVATGGPVTATITETIVSGARLRSDPTVGGSSLFVYGTSRDDFITITPTLRSATQFTVVMNGQNLGSFTVPTTNRIVVYGLDGNDYISVDPSINRTVFLYGGNGNDWLFGGGGKNVLVGGAGNDVLTGRGSSSVLIGGAGNDTLQAGNYLLPTFGLPGSLLIGNATIYDANDVALYQILQTWTVPGLSIDTRISYLKSGAVGPRLNATTVLNDGAVDTVFGSIGANWFIDYETTFAKTDRMNVRFGLDRRN
jgi:hypothetical protein